MTVAAKTVSGGLAQRYASALYELAEQAGGLDTVASDLRNLRDLVAESADLALLVTGAGFGRADQERAMTAVLTRAGADALTVRFVGVLCQNRRLAALDAVTRAYLAQLSERRGEVIAHVASARPLSDRQTQRLTEALKRKLGPKVVVDPKVDANLIGGLVVRVGSTLFDASLKTKLMRLHLAMKGVA
jgi:F-type H+-transporting ATPase subunit delta